MRRDVLEVKVWLEPGFEDGDALAWRAQVWQNRKQPMSVHGAGSTRQEAVDDCLARWQDDRARRAREAASVEWIEIRDARIATTLSRRAPLEPADSEDRSVRGRTL